MNIDKILKHYGGTVYITLSDTWRSNDFKAFIQPLRYKTKVYMTGEVTPIGRNQNNVYLYLGPAKHDLTKLNQSYILHDFDGNSYFIDRSEKITVNEKIVYIWAIIRKITEVA